jgi:hypothetical protein
LLNRPAQAENSVNVSYLTAEKAQNMESHLVTENLYRRVFGALLILFIHHRVSSISLLKDTIVRQVEDLSENIFSTLKNKCLNSVFYSVAMNKSTDATDTVQLAIFVSGVDKNLIII